MRRYYYARINLGFFNGYFKPVPNGFRDKANFFVTKYTNQSKGSTYLVWPRFLRDPLLLTQKIYFYEEKGLCFEFFTGVQIGNMIEVDPYSVYVESFCGHLYIKGGIDGNDAYELSASQFSFDVNRIMPYSDKIKMVMQEYLDIHRGFSEYKNREKAKQEKCDWIRNNADTAWLEGYINNRK